MTHELRWGLLLAALLLSASGGCSKSNGPIRGAVVGTVKFNGESVSEGSISFTPVEGTQGPTSGATIEDGQFKIAAADGPVVGKQRVSIVGQRKTGEMYDAFPPYKAMREVRHRYIPEKFNTKSELVVEVKSGKNKIDLDLKDESGDAVTGDRSGGNPGRGSRAGNSPGSQRPNPFIPRVRPPEGGATPIQK